jgi:hypothetical protein
MTGSQAKLLQSAKANWRYYAPMWLFIPALFALGRSSQLDRLTFSVVVLPAFFFAMYLAALPWLRGRAPYFHNVFWGMLLPVAAWFSLVLGIRLANAV